jgi:hypothetical protein
MDAHLSYKLDHLHRLTDCTGLLQHAIYAMPNYAEGYTTDDNARALIVADMLDGLGHDDAETLGWRYLSFLAFSFNRVNGRFRNVMDFRRHWAEEVGSDDAHGRALWALGATLGCSKVGPLQEAADWLFRQALPACDQLTSPRAWAFAVIGLEAYLRSSGGEASVAAASDALSRRLMASYRAHAGAGWAWFEDSVTYCNAALPHALIVSGQRAGDGEWLTTGLATLDWLTALQRPGEDGGGPFVPVGNHGFFPRGGERACFDQQPVEVQAYVSACLAAARVTGNDRWVHRADWAFGWFHGHNQVHRPLYDPRTGGCRDGLQPDGVNENQGAESTLAYLHAALERCLAQRQGAIGTDDAL